MKWASTLKDHVGGYGVTVDIDSGLPGPTTMIRADMDAFAVSG